MKNIIRHILKEETNKSIKLFTNLYDIEDNGSVYRGENRFQTYVTFYPKDYDNEMTREAGTSICNWEIDDDGELIFKFMSLPQPYLIPLMNYIGDTEDLEDYLEDIHVEEAEKFLKRINHRRNNPLKEDVDKNKKFLSNVIGEDVINSIQKIISPKQLPIEFLKSIGTSVIQRYIDVYGPLYYFVLDGEQFLYKERVSPKGEEYEMYITNKGKSYLDGEITDRLGLSDMGLNFSDVIDTIFNEEDDVITEDEEKMLRSRAQRRLSFIDEHINELDRDQVCDYWTKDEVDDYVNSSMANVIEQICDQIGSYDLYDEIYAYLVDKGYGTQFRDFFIDTKNNYC